MIQNNLRTPQLVGFAKPAGWGVKKSNLCLCFQKSDLNQTWMLPVYSVEWDYLAKGLFHIPYKWMEKLLTIFEVAQAYLGSTSGRIALH